MLEDSSVPSPATGANKDSASANGERVASAGSTSGEGQGTAKRPSQIPGISAFRDLINAYGKKKEDPDGLEVARREFEDQTGTIVDSYFTDGIHAGAVLVRPKGRSKLFGGESRQLFVGLDKRRIISSVPEFENAIWRTIWASRQTLREADYLLPQRTLQFSAEMLLHIASYLLGTLAALCTNMDDTSPIPQETLRVLQRTARTAAVELKKLEQYAERAAIRAAIGLYLLGLPLGAALLGAILFVANRFASLDGDVRMYGLTTIVAGGIGSIASVMLRVTRGQSLSVDIQQGPVVTVVAGMFRPLIGAVFGAALYVLVRGGLFPLGVPSESPYHFYAGLAFIAGFSERWAQDTIVRSTPITPSPAATANRAEASQRPNAPREGLNPDTYRVDEEPDQDRRQLDDLIG
jgi:hypothetical protein